MVMGDQGREENELFYIMRIYNFFYLITFIYCYNILFIYIVTKII